MRWARSPAANTGVYLWNLTQLPCPDCRPTPDLVFGYLGLMWVPANTEDRLAQAEEGKKWRWKHGTGYVVMRVLGDPDRAREHEWEDCFVGLKHHEVEVDSAWADFDLEPPPVPVTPPPEPKRSLPVRLWNNFWTPKDVYGY